MAWQWSWKLLMLAISFRECARAIDAGVDGVSSSEAHEFAMGALEALQRASPRSLAITLRHFAAVAAALHAGARPWIGYSVLRAAMLFISVRSRAYKMCAHMFMQPNRNVMACWPPRTHACSDLLHAAFPCIFMHACCA